MSPLNPDTDRLNHPLMWTRTPRRPPPKLPRWVGVGAVVCLTGIGTVLWLVFHAV